MITQIEINVNDQLFVNNKWYFDIININDNIVQVRVSYKENPTIETYLYKAINLDKTLFNKIEKTNTDLIKCEIDENALKSQIGNLISRLKIEQDYSFVYEDVAASGGANSPGAGSVSMPGINSTPGVQGSTGSMDTTNGKNFVQMLGKPYKEQEKENKKNKKKKTKTLKKALIKFESFSNFNINNLGDSQIKSKLLDVVNFKDFNEYDKLFIDEIDSNKDIMMSRSKESINQYITDLIRINATLFSNCSDYLKNQVKNLQIP